MNILIIPSWYPSKGMPGSGVFFREQALALHNSGHEVFIIDVSFHGRRDFINSKNFRVQIENDQGLRIYSFKIPSFYILSRITSINIFFFKKLLFFLFRKLRKNHKIDIIHAHSFFPAGYCACLLSKRYKLPLVVTEHSSEVLNAALKKKERPLLNFTVNHCNFFICVSQALKESVLRLTKTNQEIVVIPNIVSSLFFRQSISNGKRDFTFLSIGNLNKGKRHGFTINCFEEAFKDLPNVKFKIVGDGPEYGVLQRQINEKNMLDRVVLLGRLDREQIKTELDSCNVFVLASAFETFGIVYIEAMACGKPVIATKNGGANEIVDDTNGILIDVDNEEQLIHALRDIYQNVDRYNSLEITNESMEKYSEKVIANQLINIYKMI
jgi:glycosyltransferase involved in cell wall biosynthesis